MDLYDVPKFMSLVGLGIGMRYASFHMCGMMLLFSDMLMFVFQSGPRASR